MFIENEIEIGSERMVQNGIYARVGVNLYTAPPSQGGIRALSIQDLSLRYDHQKPQGQGWWVAMPRREYEVTNRQTNQKETRYQQIAWMFPGNQGEFSKWVQKVVEKYQEELGKKGLSIGQADPNYGRDRQQQAQAASQGAPMAPQPATSAVPAPAAPAAPVAPGGAPAAPQAPVGNPPPVWTPPAPPVAAPSHPPATPMAPPSAPVPPNGGFPN